MGNQATVAFRNADGTYDLHSSPDGATHFQLLFPLSLAATSDDPAYRDFVASLDAPEASMDTEAGLEYHFARQRAKRDDVSLPDSDPSTLLNVDPYETNVAAEELMEHLSPNDKHLYVVGDGLDLYYPAWGSIGLLDWFRQEVRIEAYDRDRQASPAQVDALVNLRPDYTYEGDGFAEMAHADSTSERYQVFRDNFQHIGSHVTGDAFAADTNDSPLQQVRIVRSDWVFVVKAQGDAIQPPSKVSRAQYPIRMALDEADDMKAVADEMAAVNERVLELLLYIDAMMMTVDVGMPERAARANAGEMVIDRLSDEFPERLSDEFLPFTL